jgi:hypothetical protein
MGVIELCQTFDQEIEKGHTKLRKAILSNHEYSCRPSFYCVGPWNQLNKATPKFRTATRIIEPGHTRDHPYHLVCEGPAGASYTPGAHGFLAARSHILASAGESSNLPSKFVNGQTEFVSRDMKHRQEFHSLAVQS